MSLYGSLFKHENIKFENIEEEADTEDTEAVLRSFLLKELGYHNTESVKIQRVHRLGKKETGKNLEQFSLLSFGTKIMRRYSRWALSFVKVTLGCIKIFLTRLFRGEDHKWKH